MKKILNGALCASLLFITACGDNADTNTDTSAAPTAPVTKTAAGEKADYQVKHRASLARALPDKTVAYLRIPHLAGYFTTPQADAIYSAISDSAVQAQSKEIIKGIDENLISKLDDPAIESILRLLLAKQESPIEVAIMAGVAGLMTPEVLLQVKLNIEDQAELESFLSGVVQSAQGLVEVTKAPENGEFQLSASGMAVFGHFDSATKDFLLFGGPTAIESKLAQYRSQSLESHDHLHVFEQRFDSAGAGLALWADLSQLWTLAAPMAPPEIMAMLTSFKVQDTQFAYLGTGSIDGVGSSRLHLQYKEGKSSPFRFLPSNSVSNAKTVGQVEYAATLPMISSENVEQLIAIDNQFSKSPSLESSVGDIRRTAKSELGVDFDQLVGTFGPSITAVKDASGVWGSLQIKDQEAFKGLISLSTEKLGAKFQTSSVGDLDIAHYTFPSIGKLAMLTQSDAAESEQVPEALLQIIAGSNTHLYMTREGSNMIVATLPQVLIARERHKGKDTVADWFEKQRTHNSTSLFSFTAQVQDLPTKAYHMYLSGIQSLSDIAGIEPNLVSLPLAEDLALADTGRIGALVQTGEQELSLVINYSQSPADFLFGGNTMAMVAVTGVLAAVAIPAYQDYTIRAKVGSSLMSASAVKVGIAEYFIDNGRFPTGNASSAFQNDNGAWFDVEREQVVIDLGVTVPELDGGYIFLTPDASEGGVLNWGCSSEGVRVAVLPSSCRN